MRRDQELVATVLAIKWRPAGQEPPTIAIIVVAPEEGSVGPDGSPLRRELSVKARIDDEEDDALLYPHACLRMYGHWSTYRDELQFEATSFIQATPATRAAVIAYLKMAPGIGPVISARLWEAHGPDAIKELREHPEQTAAGIKGLSVDDANQAAGWLQANALFEESFVEVNSILVRGGFPKSTAKKAIKEWGANAAQVIYQNPYVLQKFRGIGFKRCDALYLALKKCPHRLRRQAMCVAYGIKTSTDSGSTWFPRTHAENLVTAAIGGTKVRKEAAVELAKRGGLIVSEKTDRDQTTFNWDGDFEWVADRAKAGNEYRLAMYIAEALGNGSNRRTGRVGGVGPSGEVSADGGRRGAEVEDAVDSVADEQALVEAAGEECPFD